MSEFKQNIFVWGDLSGLGLWEIGHFRAHLAWNAALAGLTTPIIIAVWPIMNLTSAKDDNEVKFWKDAHENWHAQVRQFTNVTGVDLSFVDFKDEKSFYEWQDLHNSEHALIDHAFGIT